MSITSDILRGHTEAIILSNLLEQDGRKAYQGYKQEWQEAKEIIDKLLK